LPYVIGVANQKGGVGKTTTAVTIADGVARTGLKTLIIDLDTQSHVAVSFRQPDTDGVFNFFVKNEPIKSLVINVRENLDILPGGTLTDKVIRYIDLMDYSDNVVSEKIDPLTYDVVILDTAPTAGVMHLNALRASDFILIPSRMGLLDTVGVAKLLKTMKEIQGRGHKFKGYAVFPTFFDRNTKETLLQFQMLTESFGTKVWPPIPQDTRVREAAAEAKTLWEYCPNSNVVIGYSEGKSKVGGYKQILERVLEIIHGS
jgi:chromosome partitioning protein